jgi:N-acetylglutamate synthase-like GNAT family acetyltransferase
VRTQVIKHGQYCSVSVIDGERIIATAGMDLIGDMWWLARLVVQKPYRGKGLGREMAMKLKENADGFPIQVMPGGYDLTKEEQFAFYEKCGFVKTDENTLVLQTKGGA